MKHTARMATMVVAALAIGACTGSGYISTGGTPTSAYTHQTVAVNRWQDPSFFQAQTNQRLSNVEQRVRADIASGQLPAEAINDFNQQRVQVQQSVASFSTDGMIDPNERRYVRDLIRNAASIRPAGYGMNQGAYHNGYNNGAYGGGPGQFNYYDSSWDWGL